MENNNSIFQDLEHFGKERLFQNGYGTILDFCLGSSKIFYNGLNSIFVHFAICNSIHNPPKKIRKYGIEKNFFPYFCGASKCEQKCVSWFWKLLLWLWKSIGNALRVVCTNPGSIILKSPHTHLLYFVVVCSILVNLSSC